MWYCLQWCDAMLVYVYICVLLYCTAPLVYVELINIVVACGLHKYMLDYWLVKGVTP